MAKCGMISPYMGTHFMGILGAEKSAKVHEDHGV